MRIVLLKDIPNLGKKGDIKEVKDGYGRNFLIRNKLAVMATPQLEKQLIFQKENEEKALAALKEKLLDLKTKLGVLKLVFKTKIGETGRAFGSVTPIKILSELKKRGIYLEKEQILTEPIKTLGGHKVKIKLSQGIEAILNISIEGGGAKKR